MRYRFGDFEVDAGRFTLTRRGAPVRIEPRPLSLLILLLERHPDAVPRDELLDRLWPDAVVLEGSLTRAVREVRRALRERAETPGGVMRTVRGRGYAIGVPIEVVGRGSGTGGPAVATAPLGPSDAERPPPPRRRLAILSADLVDHTGHVEADREGTAARLAALREIAAELVAAHRGLLVHFVEDALLAVFPSALDATDAALAFRERVGASSAARPDARPLSFRTGVHLAALIEDGGRVYGGGVRVAGGLERLAAPGAICLSAAVRDRLGTRLPDGLVDLGERRVKGVAEPIRVYCLPPPAAGHEGR